MCLVVMSRSPKSLCNTWGKSSFKVLREARKRANLAKTSENTKVDQGPGFQFEKELGGRTSRVLAYGFAW